VGGATLRNDLEQGPYDQAPVVESRSDILKFTSIQLGQNVVMRGKATVHLFVSCDRKDTDYSIRLTDVYPDGRSMLLAEGIRRLRFRNGYGPADTAAAVAGTIYEVIIDLPDIANTFLAGHKIRVDVSSSNYPRYDCNLNNGLAMYAAGDTLIATSLVQLNTSYASYIELPLVDFTGGTKETELQTEWQLFPNPAVDEVTLERLQNVNSETPICIFNANGELVLKVLSAPGATRTRINISQLPSGIYLIKAGDHQEKFIHIKP
jgi:hypothetical protein